MIMNMKVFSCGVFGHVDSEEKICIPNTNDEASFPKDDVSISYPSQSLLGDPHDAVLSLYFSVTCASATLNDYFVTKWSNVE